MRTIGPGVAEIRIHDEGGGVIYIATRDSAIYVLHAFQKKTPRTAKRDLDLAAARLRQI
jgi:phage-related protein